MLTDDCPQKHNYGWNPSSGAVQRFRDDDCYGLYSHRRKLITLDKTLKGKDLYETLRHEMIHAAFAISGLGYCERYEEEAIVRCMDEIFFPAWERTSKRLTKNERCTTLLKRRDRP